MTQEVDGDMATRMENGSGLAEQRQYFLSKDYFRDSIVCTANGRKTCILAGSCYERNGGDGEHWQERER